MTYPLIGNYGRLIADDQSERPWLRGLVVAHATAAVLDDARQLATLLRGQRDPGHRRRGHPRPRAPPAGQRLPAGDHHGAGHDGPRRRRRARPRRARGGRTRTSWPRSRPPPCARWATTRPRRWSRSWTTGSRPTSSAPSAAAASGCASCRTRRRRRRCSRRTSPASSSRRARATRRGSTDPWRWPARSSTTAARSWASASATRSSARAAGAETGRLRFGHHGANHPVQDLDTGYVQVTAQNHEVQVLGESLPASSGFRVSPAQPQRPVGGGAAARGQAHRDRPVPPGGRPGAARRARRVRPVRRRLPARRVTADARCWSRPRGPTGPSRRRC